MLPMACSSGTASTRIVSSKNGPVSRSSDNIFVSIVGKHNCNGQLVKLKKMN